MKIGKLTIKWSYEGKHITMCTISYEDSQVPPIIGYAERGKKDSFCKDTGRKISLARALKLFTSDKEYRKEIWEAYRNMKPLGRW